MYKGSKYMHFSLNGQNMKLSFIDSDLLYTGALYGRSDCILCTISLKRRINLIRNMQDLNIIYIQYSIQFYIRLEKKYAPALDNYGQSCFVRSDFLKMKCVCKTKMMPA